MKILLACSAGMSTSLLEKSMREFIIRENKSDSVMAISIAEAKNCLQQYDVVLLGPQVRYALNELKFIAPNLPIGIIAPVDYALAKGEAVYQTACNLVNEK